MEEVGINNFFSHLSFDKNIVTLTNDETHKCCGFIYQYSKEMNKDIEDDYEFI